MPNAYLLHTACLPCRTASLALLVGVLLLCSGLADAARDPTRPPADLSPTSGSATSNEAMAPLVLQAVLRDAQGSRAMIGGHVLRVGDQHADARVLSIHLQSVWIERQGLRQLLRLAEPVMQPSR